MPLKYIYMKFHIFTFMLQELSYHFRDSFQNFMSPSMFSVQMHETLMRSNLSDFCNHLGARKKNNNNEISGLGKITFLRRLVCTDKTCLPTDLINNKKERNLG